MKRIISILFLLLLPINVFAYGVLKQSTATNIVIGPFLDDTDFKTSEDALTVTGFVFYIYKGATESLLTITASGGNNDCVTLHNGYYNCELTTGNTDTLGRFRVTVNVTGALPVWEDYTVEDQDTAGYHKVTIKDGTGAGEIDTASGAIAIDVGITQTGADKVWGTTARVLTAGTNIVLAKGVGVTGFNDVSTAEVNTQADLALSDYDPPTRAELTTDKDSIITQIDANETKIDAVDDYVDTEVAAIKAKTDNLPSGIKKNTIFNNFEFLMRDSTNHAPAAGLTVTCTRSIDGGAFAACANAVVEVASGVYKVSFAATDLNGDFITLKMTAALADQTTISIKTNP